jgi:hypothetical protein
MMAMSTGELDERQPVNDQAQALLLGEEFHLGALEQVSRSRKLPKYAAWGALCGAIVFVGGLPAVIGLAAGPYTHVSKAVVAGVVSVLLATCCLLVGVGLARATFTSRLYRYSDGLAQIVGDEAEPRVTRWADVKDFTVHLYESDEVAPRIDGFRVTTSLGTTLPGVRGQRHRRELRALVAEADRNLAPRLVPAMTEAYESGAPVSFGRVQVSKEGITLSAWPPPGALAPWSQVKSIHMTHIASKYGDYVHEIIVGRKGMPTEEIRVDGLANGIFLPLLLAHAAAGHGVMVTGYHKDGGGIPSNPS